EEFLRRLFRMDRRAGNSPLGWVESSLLLYVLLAAVLGLLAVFVLRTWRRRNPTIVAARAEAIARTPDVADENVGASALPEDGWLKLARELLEKGEFRLAMRALYL